MKAKLAFVECENEALQEQLRQLETALAGKRDELASLKSTRDRLWQQQRQLKEGSVFVTNPLLLQDMQVSCVVGGRGGRECNYIQPEADTLVFLLPPHTGAEGEARRLAGGVGAAEAAACGLCFSSISIRQQGQHSTNSSRVFTWRAAQVLLESVAPARRQQSKVLQLCCCQAAVVWQPVMSAGVC